MRLTWTFFRNARQPQNENKVPFKAVLPLKLRSFVSSKSEKTQGHSCLHEMTMLLTCLEENEFDDKRCVPQFQMLNKCVKIYKASMQHVDSAKEQTVPVPNSKNLTHKQITYLLRRYPTV